MLAHSLGAESSTGRQEGRRKLPVRFKMKRPAARYGGSHARKGKVPIEVISSYIEIKHCLVQASQRGIREIFRETLMSFMPVSASNDYNTR